MIAFIYKIYIQSWTGFQTAGGSFSNLNDRSNNWRINSLRRVRPFVTQFTANLWQLIMTTLFPVPYPHRCYTLDGPTLAFDGGCLE